MSCSRTVLANTPANTLANTLEETSAENPAAAAWQGARPMAVLQAGAYPLWFQLTENGPVLLETIEDAVFSAALVPWPLALHVRFFMEKENELFLAVNRGGFLKLVPFSGETNGQKVDGGFALFRFGGGSFFSQYTIGGFVFYENKPAVLLYLDDRFLDSAAPLPQPRTWTFNMDSNTPFPLEIPALEQFPAGGGWDADTLRPGSDGFFYYRIKNETLSPPELRMLRTNDLSQAGEEISLEAFYASIPREIEIPEHFSLPPLPENFVYTYACIAGGSLFACWEEQEEYNIGASGFMLVKRLP